MSTRENIYFGHANAKSPEPKSQATSGASATYQATGADVGKLHEFCAAVDCLVKGGTGSSVTITGTAGQLVKAGVIYLFRPISGRESLGFKTLDGSAFSSTAIATVATREPA